MAKAAIYGQQSVTWSENVNRDSSRLSRDEVFIWTFLILDEILAAAAEILLSRDEAGCR